MEAIVKLVKPNPLPQGLPRRAARAPLSFDKSWSKLQRPSSPDAGSIDSGAPEQHRPEDPLHRQRPGLRRLEGHRLHTGPSATRVQTGASKPAHNSSGLLYATIKTWAPPKKTGDTTHEGGRTPAHRSTCPRRFSKRDQTEGFAGSTPGRVAETRPLCRDALERLRLNRIAPFFRSRHSAALADRFAAEILGPAHLNSPGAPGRAKFNIDLYHRAPASATVSRTPRKPERSRSTRQVPTIPTSRDIEERHLRLRCSRAKTSAVEFLTRCSKKRRGTPKKFEQTSAPGAYAPDDDLRSNDDQMVLNQPRALRRVMRRWIILSAS